MLFFKFRKFYLIRLTIAKIFIYTIANYRKHKMAGWFRKKIKNSASSTKETFFKVINYDEAKENWGTIKDMYEKGLKVPKDNNTTTKKTFHETVIEQGLTQADLNQMYFNYAVSFYISMFFAIVCLISACYSAFISGSFMGFLVGLAIFFVCLSSMFRFSMDSFKIRHQKFCSLQDWWNNPNFWFPKLKL